MARSENCVLTNMCMICRGEQVLVLNKVDPAWPGICFPGGHVEKGESFIDSVRREMLEETGLNVGKLKLCGMRQFTKETGEYRYIVLLYKTDDFTGELRSSNEGEVFWTDRGALRSLPLADGFAEMLDVFENDDLTENFYWFENGRWKYENK